MRYLINYRLDAIVDTEDNERAERLLANGYVELTKERFEEELQRVWNICLERGY